MLKLSPGLLKLSLTAIRNHGYGDFFPEPPEFDLVKSNWKEVRNELASIDLDTFEGHGRLSAFAPKSRLNLRRVTLLHPYDLILYTGLVLALRDSISRNRVPPSKKRVFSYRAEGAAKGLLYKKSPGYKEFREGTIKRATKPTSAFVGLADIADFYSRIYQHRLVNALAAIVETNQRDYVRVLEKMLARFSDGVSYGIPIGPPASRPLGEAILIDVDSALLGHGVDFMRFSDDFVIFGRNPKTAELGIRILGETLYLNHGLTLQTAKTEVLPIQDYLEKRLTAHTEKEEARRKLLEIFGAGDYEVVPYESLDDAQRQELDAMNLSGMLTEALAEDHNVDFREVSFILGKLSALRKPELIPIVLQNLDRLSPVAHSITSFFREFAALDDPLRRTVTRDLLRPILGNPHVSEYYSMWVLSLFFYHPDWNHAEDLIKIFRRSSSEVLRRYAALALSTSGTRAQALEVKQLLQSTSASPSLTRTAMLLASRKLGTDERKHLKKSLRITDTLEKLCAQH